LVVVSAVYFLGKWKKPFKVDDTVALPFFMGSGDQPPPLSVSWLLLIESVGK
jgi:serine protease inhibitor